MIFSKYNLISKLHEQIVILNTLYKTIIYLDKEHASALNDNLLSLPQHELYSFLVKNKMIVERDQEKEFLDKMIRGYQEIPLYRFVFLRL